MEGKVKKNNCGYLPVIIINVSGVRYIGGERKWCLG